MRIVVASPRLAAHRLRWVRDRHTGPLIPFNDLSEIERKFLVDEVMSRIKIRRLSSSEDVDEQIFDELLLDVLNEWGVMCKHPTVIVSKTNFGRCDLCGCEIFLPWITRQSKRAQR
jgi:hypothetical protein